MKFNKKILSFGSILITTLPILALISCGNDSKPNPPTSDKVELTQKIKLI